MKIGIFGGTFNPPHIGHLIVAEHVREKLFLDKILFMPAAIPPHKIFHDITSSDQRLEMLRLAVEDNPKFEVSDLELRRGGISFTVDTLHTLNRMDPDASAHILIGMDNLLEFHSWKSPEVILQLSTVVVMTRPGFDADAIPVEMKNRVTVCPVPEINIASREIRKRLSNGDSIRYLLPESVRQYIDRNKLYR